MNTTLPLNKWASPAQLLQIAADYREAVAIVDKQGWTKAISDGKRDGAPVCAARALGLVVGMESGDKFAGRASLALSAFYRVTGILLVHANDTATQWSDLRSMMIGIATDCENAARIGAYNA